MELEGRIAVVTGAAGGIGRALAHRFADAGAAGLFLVDLDRAAAEHVAAEIGDRAAAYGADLGETGSARTVIQAAEETFGRIDLFCANAGVAIGLDLESSDEVWDRAFAVNVRTHIEAARILVPQWLERGEGYFLTTASAAGLLSQIGSAPYAVTKHAAVAFAEWLSLTYGDRGIRASCLCPMGVNTKMLTADSIGAVGNVVRAAGQVLEPEQVADAVVDGLRDERFLILPHPEVLTFFQRKAADYDRWLAGMRRLQARIVGS
jgi:NAD(P)-dependent dehydrogenase (short-subunit alcohol dehydrogenase family)